MVPRSTTTLTSFVARVSRSTVTNSGSWPRTWMRWSTGRTTTGTDCGPSSGVTPLRSASAMNDEVIGAGTPGRREVADLDDRIERVERVRPVGWFDRRDGDRGRSEGLGTLGQHETAVQERREADRGELEGPVVDDDPEDSGHRGARAAERGRALRGRSPDRTRRGVARGWDRAGSGSRGRAAPR